MSSGSLATDLNALEFRTDFNPEETSLLGVVAFDEIPDGSVVQATWFSPDDRRMPLGRTQIVTESGAKVARFSFARAIPWDPAPYLLQVHAWPKDHPEATASGSIQFFIGMTEEEKKTYADEFAAWKKTEEEERIKREEEAAKNPPPVDPTMMEEELL